MRGLGAALSLLAVLGFPGAVTSSHASEPSSYVPGEVLVRFAGSATASARADALSDLDATVVERLPLSGLVRVRLAPGTSVESAAAALERRAGVRYAEPNHRYQLTATPNDQYFSSLWGMTKIEAPAAWETRTDSNAVTVAVVDTGVDYTHVDIQDNVWANDDPIGGGDNDGNGYVDDVRGWDFAYGDNDPSDDEGHGTHVAGTIGARGNNTTGVTGVNWRVKLMALKAADSSGLEESWIVDAFHYACANGAKVINGSFGGSSYSQAILDSINACPGSLFVVAAGNGGPDGVGDNNDSSPVYPCSYIAANIVCVAATTSGDVLASFSNYGVNSVDLAAPGVSILSTVPPAFDVDPADGNGYDTYHGTSMATPHVAGAAALVLANSPGLTTAELRRALLLAVDAKPSLIAVVATGGRLNVRRALSQDIVAPTGLTAQSSSPSFNAWSNGNTATASWGGATDTAGIDGYSFAWSPDATFSPDETKEVEENVTTTSATLPDGRLWFHVRARDNSGNWGDPVHLGPFQVDTFAPVRPTLSSPSHRAGAASADRTVQINWITLGDSLSGLDGYSFAWGRQSLFTVDQTKDAEESATRTVSQTLSVGTWWFGIRARDNAGNWTDPTFLGPFVISGGPTACTVPRLRGQTVALAKRTLARRGCRMGRVSRAYSRRVGRGRIVSQRPAPGLRLRRGARVAVVVSRGRHRR
jgi:subtilisin family serine protease